MPNAFDIGKYTTDFNPIAGGPFVSIQDVMSSWGDVFGEIIQLLPQLLNLIEQLPAEFGQIVTSLIGIVFPPDGSASPLLTGLQTAISGFASGFAGQIGNGGFVDQLINIAITILPSIISQLSTLLTNPGNLLSGFTSSGISILDQLIGAVGGSGSGLGGFANLFGGLGSLQTLLTGFTGGVPLLSQLVGVAGGNTAAPNILGEFGNLFGGLGSLTTLFSGFTAGTPLLTQLISAGGGTGSTLTDFVSTFAGSASAVISTLLSPGNLLNGFANGSSILTQLPSLLTWPLTALSGGILPSSITLGGLSQIPGLTGLLSGLDTSGGTSLLGQLPNLLALPMSAITGLLDSGTGSIFPNLLGMIPSNLLPQLGLGNITTAPTNLLMFPNFDQPSEIVGEGIWGQDSTMMPGASKAGAAVLNANGVTNTLWSNIIQVSPGDSITEKISSTWASLATTGGSVIQLIGRVWDTNKNTLDTPVIASVSSPGSDGSQVLSGTYTVVDNPYPGEPMYMSMGLRVMSAATAGVVKFGAGMWTKGNQIPGTSVLGLSGLGSTITGDLNSLLTGGITSLGGVPGGNLISMFTGLLGAIPGTNVLGIGGAGTSIAGDLNSLLTGGITSLGGVPGGNLISMFTGLLGAIPGTNVLGLSGGTGNLLGDLQHLLDSGSSVLGGAASGNTVSSFTSLLQLIPFTNVGGILGPDNIGGTVQTNVDTLWQTFTGLMGTGNSFQNLQSAAQQVVSNTSSAVNISQNVSATIAQKAVTKPLHVVIDPTMDVTVPLNDCVSGATLSTVSVTSASSVIGMISTPDAGIKESIAWYSTSALTNITGFYVALYKVNTSTGAGTLLYQSPNIVGSVTTGGWNYYNLPVANYATSAQGDAYAVEIAITGTGTYTLAGLPSHPITANPNVFPKQLGASRSTSGGFTAPSSINPFLGSASVPFFGLSGSEGASQVAPVTTEFLSSGTYNVPTWAQVAGAKFDIVVLGAGGGAGGGGGGFASGSGAGGWAGHFYAITLTYGVDIPLGTTQFTVTVGVGGAGGHTIGGNGLAGSATTVTITGYTGPAITAAGGAVTTTSTYWSNTANGQGAGTEQFNSQPYPGGAEQTSNASPGVSPGGGGSGGFNANGGPGAGGAAWIRAYIT